jgi:lipooligosaccharide transport system ATP-binding protein
VLELRFPMGEQAAARQRLEDLPAPGERLEPLPDRLLLYTDDGERAASRVQAQGVAPLSMLVRRSSMEDVFLRLTGRTLVD